MADFEKARMELLKMDINGEESIEEFWARIFEVLIEYAIYTDYEWKCKSSYIGGEG